MDKTESTHIQYTISTHWTAIKKTQDREWGVVASIIHVSVVPAMTPIARTGAYAPNFCGPNH